VAVPFLVGLAAANGDAKALGRFLDVRDIDRDELGATGRARKANEQQGAVANGRKPCPRQRRRHSDDALGGCGAKQYAAANSALKLKAELSGHYVQRKEDVTPRLSEAEIDARLLELLAGGDLAGSSETPEAAPKPRGAAQLN
jgi:hypothetical protein